jgi:hypothetical protein
VKSWLLDVKEQAPVPNPVLAVTYEGMVKDTEHELKKILEFTKVPYSTTRLRAVVTAGYNQYHRRHNTMTSDHYTAQQKSYVRHHVEKIWKLLKISYASLDLTSYMQP